MLQSVAHNIGRILSVTDYEGDGDMDFMLSSLVSNDTIPELLDTVY